MQLSFALHEYLINSYKLKTLNLNVIYEHSFHLSTIFPLHFGTVPSVVFLFIFIFVYLFHSVAYFLIYSTHNDL